VKQEHAELLSKACEAARHAYAPYSRFRVGAAILADGQVFIGVNVENASSGIGLCAERSAMAHAMAHGCREITGIAVCCMDADLKGPPEKTASLTMPCGACRQWMAELAPKAWLVTNGSKEVYCLEDLLPNAFTLSRSSPSTKTKV